MASGMVGRMIRAARLDASLYEEVEADPRATHQAMNVVLLSAAAAGIGAGQVSGLGVIVQGLAALVGWYVWAYVIYFIGTRMLPGVETRSEHSELLRTLGFASAPGVLRVFGVLPGAGMLIISAASFWQLAATVVAVRAALDYPSAARAIAVCVIGFIVQIVVIAVLVGLTLGSRVQS